MNKSNQVSDFSYTAERLYYANPVTVLKRYEWLDDDLRAWIPNLPTIFTGRQILDIGSGETLQGILICERYNPESYTGLEYIFHRMLAARTRMDDLPKLRLTCGDCYHLPFDSNSFDIVIGNGILHHLPNLPLVVAQITRVLRPGGLYLGREPNFLNPLVYKRVLNKHRSLNEHAIYASEIRDSFLAVGFSLQIDYFWRRFAWLHYPLLATSVAIHAAKN